MFSPPYSVQHQTNAPNLIQAAANATTPKGHNAPLPYVTLPVTSPVDENLDQLMSILSSPKVPKDPYLVILDKGLPTERTYLVEPNKNHQTVSPGGKLQLPVGNFPPPVGNFPLVTSPLITQQQQIQTIVPTVNQGFSSQGLSQLFTPSPLEMPTNNGQQNDVKPQNLQPCNGKPESKASNSDHKNDSKGSHSESSNAGSDDGKPNKVYQLTPNSLPPEEQLKAFLSSKLCPKDHAYYVVVNKGQKDEATFLIEPNKKGKSKQSKSKDEGWRLLSDFFVQLQYCFSKMINMI